MQGNRDYAATAATLRQAIADDPSQLATYVDLYKLCFYSCRFAEAESVARASLDEAARQGGFAADWQQAQAVDQSWRLSGTPQRAYLYSLKALSFILLRQERLAEAQDTLSHLQRLDPDDLVGGSVIRELAESLHEEADGGR